MLIFLNLSSMVLSYFLQASSGQVRVTSEPRRSPASPCTSHFRTVTASWLVELADSATKHTILNMAAVQPFVRRAGRTSTDDLLSIGQSLTIQDPAAGSPSSPSRDETELVNIGDRVVVNGRSNGVLRYWGAVQFSSGNWAGVELDEPGTIFPVCCTFDPCAIVPTSVCAKFLQSILY